MGLQVAREDVRARPRAMRRIFDPKFRLHPRRYLLQCAAATVTVFVVLLGLDAFHQTVLVAALGASAFIAFTMPHVNASRPRYLLGGYLVGIAVGCSMSLLAGMSIPALPPALAGGAHLGFAAIATGVAIFVMVITDTEHPPAAGLALGFVMNEWDLATIAVVFVGVAVIAACKESSRATMMDLL